MRRHEKRRVVDWQPRQIRSRRSVRFPRDHQRVATPNAVAARAQYPDQHAFGVGVLEAKPERTPAVIGGLEAISGARLHGIETLLHPLVEGPRKVSVTPNAQEVSVRWNLAEASNGFRSRLHDAVTSRLVVA
jgi:hypothetical protein